MKKIPFWCLILLLAVSTIATFAQTQAQMSVLLPHEISGPIDVRPLAMQWRTPRTKANFADALQAWEQGAFQEASFYNQRRSMTQDAIWYRVVIDNSSATDHRVHLVLGANFLAFGQAVVDHDGAFDTVLSESNTQPFSEREIQTSRLVSRALEIQKGSHTVLWIGIAVDGSSGIGLKLMTPQDLEASHLSFSNLQTAYYVSIALIGLFMLGFLFVYFSWAQFFYLSFFLILATYNAQLSGLMFQWVWPNAPWWNSYASHYIGLSGIMCAAWASWLFVSTKLERPLFKVATVVFQTIGLLAMAAPVFLPLVTVKALLGPIVLLFLIIQFWGAFIAIRNRLDGSVLIAAASFILVSYLGVFTIGSQVDGLIPTFAIVIALHFGPLLDGVLRFFSTVLQSYQLKQKQADGVRLLEHLQNALDATRHDMRQPLGTMHMALNDLELETDRHALSETLSTMRQSLEYLEDVVDGSASTGTKGARIGAGDAEIAPVSLYLSCMRRMFLKEAAAQGIKLRIVHSSAFVIAPPLALTRILSNLVQNAILHSKGDKIVIGVRRLDMAKASIQILDNGIGYNLPKEPSRPTWRKSATRHGNGLWIALDLAQSCGLKLAVTSRPKQLTSTTLDIPLAPRRRRRNPSPQDDPPCVN